MQLFFLSKSMAIKFSKRWIFFFDLMLSNKLVWIDCGDEKAVRFMVENAPDAIASLEEIGVLFTQEDGQ
jgi:succinate dehydrogenase/fumarate reductase flavoprotein subunit